MKLRDWRMSAKGPERASEGARQPKRDDAQRSVRGPGLEAPGRGQSGVNLVDGRKGNIGKERRAQGKRRGSVWSGQYTFSSVFFLKTDDNTLCGFPRVKSEEQPVISNGICGFRTP